MPDHTMRRALGAAVITVASLGVTAPVSAQTFATDDPVLQRIWQLGMTESQVYPLAQALLDSVGPRLAGSPGQLAAHDWAVSRFRSWGIDADNEQYGTWRGWRRGTTHVDLLVPRVRTLEATMMAWSPGTDGPVERDVVLLPDVADEAGFRAWLPQARGRFVATAFAQPTCRPDRQWEEFATPESWQRFQVAREQAQVAWSNRLRATGLSAAELRLALEQAGALGIVESRWSNDYGVNKVFGTNTTTIPTIDVSCEDYGLLARLAAHGQSPRIRVDADAAFTGDAPAFNTIATIRGSEKPDEYVLLSAHFDSWDAGSGATDNGTGTVTMMEAARILKQVYPNPKRTIIVGLWGGEEQGLNGSRAYAHDHPEVVAGLQALFNQDNGTGRVVNISMQGLTEAGAYFARWLAHVPQEITRHIDLNIPGTPGGGGSDYASFICAGAPAFGLSSLGWGYGTYTWHTNRDTFDKLVIEDVQNNATLTAMLAYLASEEPDLLPRDRRVLPISERTGEQMTWPACRDGARTAP